MCSYMKSESFPRKLFWLQPIYAKILNVAAIKVSNFCLYGLSDIIDSMFVYVSKLERAFELNSTEIFSQINLQKKTSSIRKQNHRSVVIPLLYDLAQLLSYEFELFLAEFSKAYERFLVFG